MAESDQEFIANVYASDSMIYWDREMTRPITQTLYQRKRDDRLYVDPNYTTALHIIPSSAVSETGESSTEERELPQNQSFSKEQTLFLIDLMRQHLIKDDCELPRNLMELNSRIRMARGKKKLFWQEITTKLKTQFHQNFEIEKVSRKWTTLEDAYKKAIDNNASTGKAPTKFQFFKEMSELIGGHHDIDFPVVGTAKGVIVRRPEVIKKGISATATPFAGPAAEEGPSSLSSSFDAAQSSDSESSGPSPLSLPAHTAVKRKRKPQEEKTQVMGFLRECEEASQRRHDEIMGQIKVTNALFEKLLQSRQQN